MDEFFLENDFKLTDILASIHKYINEIASEFPEDQELKNLSWTITNKLILLDTQLTTQSIDNSLASFREALKRLRQN